MNLIRRLLGAVAVAIGTTLSVTAWAGTVHYLAGAGVADPTAPIAASGNTAVGLNDLTAADLAGVQVLWITNGNNDSAPLAVLNNLGALAQFVRSGGVLSYHDRYVSGDPNVIMSNVLPGAGGAIFVRDFGNDADIDILNNTTMVTNGLNDTSLDGGTSSSHGYVDAASLPAGAVGILNRGGAVDEIVDFYYGFGAGWVYYSTIPLDFYLGGNGPNPPRSDFTDVYAVNEVGFQASLVPEPASLALIGLALAGLGLSRRRA